MAKFGRYKVGLNSKAKPFAVIMNIVMLFIWLYVGDLVIQTIMDLIYVSGAVPTTNVFYNVFKLFGVAGDSDTNGLVGVIGLIMGVGVLLQAIRVTRL